MNVSSDVSKFAGKDVIRFATAQWSSSFESGIVPMAIGNESIAKAVLNVFVYKKLGKTVLINPPLAENCGLSIHFETAKEVGINSEVKRVMRTLAQHLNAEFANAYIDIAFPPEIKDIQPFLQAGFKSDIGYTYRLNLHSSEKDLLREFSSERRKNVRDAEKAGLKVELNENPENVLKLLEDTWQRSGLNIDSAILLRMLRKEWTYSISISDNAERIATAVIAFDQNTAYYIAGGTAKNTSTSGAGALALWEAIKKAKELNLTKFDFCGSSIPSIEKFFRGFGGELTPYFRVRNNHKIFDLLKTMKDKIDSK